MKIQLSLLFSIITLLSLGQVSNHFRRKIPPQQLQQDFNLFKTVLLSAHPNPYRIHDPGSFGDELDAYEQLLSDSLTSLEFFQIMSAVMSNVGEAHSHVNISNEIEQQVKAVGKLLPLNIHFYEKRAFVLKDLSTESSSLTAREILSINGKSIDRIINTIDSISCIGSGLNRSRIYRKLSYKRNFALCYYLYVNQSQSFLIEYSDGETEEVKATVIDGIIPDFEISTILVPLETTPPFSLTIDKQRDLATLKIKTFAHFVIGYKARDYQKFFQKSFRQIDDAKVKNLVIDVRGNRGGQERLGAYLLSYLIDEPIRLQEYIFAKNLDYQLLDSLKIFHHEFRPKYFIAVDSGYLSTDGKHHVISPIKPMEKNSFSGNVYILTDGNCFSACNIFVSYADFHRIGAIVGEETGGNYQDTDGYYGVIFKLPNSELEIEFRLWYLRTNVKSPNNGRGVLPDVPIQSNVTDVLNARDAAMEKVYELIEQSGSH